MLIQKVMWAAWRARGLLIAAAPAVAAASRGDPQDFIEALGNLRIAGFLSLADLLVIGPLQRDKSNEAAGEESKAGCNT